MFFNFGEKLKIEVYGESHSEKIGAVLYGVAKGERIDLSELKTFVERRKSRGEVSTARRENDDFVINSGLDGDITNGNAIEISMLNADVRPQDYDDIKYTPRPSTADYPAYIKTGKIPSGGGRFSGRMTAPLCVAGGIVLQILKKRGIEIKSAVQSVGEIAVDSVNPVTGEIIHDSDALSRAVKESEKAKSDGDSLGGTAICVITGVPVGTGDSLFCGLDGALSVANFGIPSVKGVQFGSGFNGAKSFGSKNNDQIISDDGKIKMLSNNDGGIVGGMANGMPVIFSVAFKPVPSIAKTQKSVNLKTGEPENISVAGRHDSCILFRVLPIIESVSALAVYSALPPASDISGLREKINSIDDGIARGLSERDKAVKKIGEIKKETGVPVRDATRENRIVERLKKDYPQVADYIEKVYNEIFEISRKRQK